jgi:hypothetical protein
MIYNITCAECGQPYEAKRANARICAFCRFLRDLNFMGGRKHECWRCHTKFAPLHQKDESCGEHTYKRISYGEAECVFCGDTKLRVHPDVNVCHTCVRDPFKRAGLLDRLEAKQQERVARSRHAAGS